MAKKHDKKEDEFEEVSIENTIQEIEEPIVAEVEKVVEQVEEVKEVEKPKKAKVEKIEEPEFVVDEPIVSPSNPIVEAKKTFVIGDSVKYNGVPSIVRNVRTIKVYDLDDQFGNTTRAVPEYALEDNSINWQVVAANSNS